MNCKINPSFGRGEEPEDYEQEKQLLDHDEYNIKIKSFDYPIPLWIGMNHQNSTKMMQKLLICEVHENGINLDVVSNVIFYKAHCK